VKINNQYRGGKERPRFTSEGACWVWVEKKKSGPGNPMRKTSRGKGRTAPIGGELKEVMLSGVGGRHKDQTLKIKGRGQTAGKGKKANPANK